MKTLTLVALLAGATSAGAMETRSIYNFYPKSVTCHSDASGTYGSATGLAGEGAGDLDVRIVDGAGFESQKAYRKTLCEILRVAAKNRTSVDLTVADLRVPEPEGESEIQAVVSITAGHGPSM